MPTRGVLKVPLIIELILMLPSSSIRGLPLTLIVVYPLVLVISLF